MAFLTGTGLGSKDYVINIGKDDVNQSLTLSRIVLGKLVII